MSARRRAKIICTIGPSCNTEAALRDLMRLGMDVARLNFSHGSHDDHARNIERLRKSQAKKAAPSASCRTCKAQRFALGKLKDHVPITLETGSTVIITSRET